MLERYNIKHHILIGPTKEADRDKVTKDFTSGKVRFLLSKLSISKRRLRLVLLRTPYTFFTYAEDKNNHSVSW